MAIISHFIALPPKQQQAHFSHLTLEGASRLAQHCSECHKKVDELAGRIFVNDRDQTGKNLELLSEIAAKLTNNIIEICSKKNFPVPELPELLMERGSFDYLCKLDAAVRYRGFQAKFMGDPPAWGELWLPSEEEQKEFVEGLLSSPHISFSAVAQAAIENSYHPALKALGKAESPLVDREEYQRYAEFEEEALQEYRERNP